MKIFMKKFIILFLLTIAPTKLAALFIRGAIYKNEKTGQIVILLADLHRSYDSEENFSLQRKDLISNLKLLSKESNIILVEDKSEINIDKIINSHIYKVIENSSEDNKASSLKDLTKDLKNNFLNFCNEECRFLENYFFEEKKLMLKHQEGPNNEFLISDLDDENKMLIKNLEKKISDIKHYKERFSEKEYNHIEKYFNDAIEYAKKRYSKTLKKLYALETDHNLPSFWTLENKAKLIELSNIIPQDQSIFIDSNFLYSIIKNNDKKIITICAGMIHTNNIECFLSNIGYKMINEIGEKSDQSIIFFNKMKFLESMEDHEKESMKDCEIKEIISYLEEFELYLENLRDFAIDVDKLFKNLN